jgi:hypothetical protein
VDFPGNSPRIANFAAFRGREVSGVLIQSCGPNGMGFDSDMKGTLNESVSDRLRNTNAAQKTDDEGDFASLNFEAGSA